MTSPNTRQTPPNSGLSVLVVGAGPVGAFAALECRRKGHSVRVVERHPVARTMGDTFTIGPSVINHIQQAWPDMSAENEAISHDPWFSWHTMSGDKLAGPAPFDWVSHDSKKPREVAPPSRIYRHSRARFLAMLLSQLRDKMGVEVEYGSRVVDYYEDEEKAGVMVERGLERSETERIEADIVVAADGIGTKSHRLVNGHDIRAWSSGLASFRAAFDVDLIKKDQELDHRFPVLENGHPVMEMWQGGGLMFMVYRTEEFISWFLMHKDDGESHETWHQSVEPPRVLQVLEREAPPDFPDYAKRLIQSTPSIIDYPLMWRNPQPTITSPLGRVVQVGDAAHSFLPTSAGGANQGIEDSISLACCLDLAWHNMKAKPECIGWATKTHAKLRFERVSCHQLAGLLNSQRSGRSGDSSSKEKQDASDVKWELGQWIWAHDPERYALDNFDKALDHVRNGAAFGNTNTPPGYVYTPWSVDALMAQVKEGKPIEVEGDWS